MSQASPELGVRKFQSFYLIWAVSVHLIGLLTMYFFFEPWAFGFAFTLAAITAYSMGIFHHMYLSHLSFTAHPWLVNIGSLLGTLTWRGPMAAPVRYAALHRVHHRYSDKDYDPHSPVHGKFHSLLGWNWYYSDLFNDINKYGKLAPKPIRENRFLCWLDQNVNLLQATYGIGLFLVGYALYDLHTAIVFLLYGVFVKTLMVVYLANAVDLINHTVGYRNYEIQDQSQNSMIMAAVHLGGAISWHNNHHAKPSYFKVKNKWWEFDVHYLMLRFLSLFGLVSEIRVLDETQAATLTGNEA